MQWVALFVSNPIKTECDTFNLRRGQIMILLLRFHGAQLEYF